MVGTAATGSARPARTPPLRERQFEDWGSNFNNLPKAPVAIATGKRDEAALRKRRGEFAGVPGCGAVPGRQAEHCDSYAAGRLTLARPRPVLEDGFRSSESPKETVHVPADSIERQRRSRDR